MRSAFLMVGLAACSSSAPSSSLSPPPPPSIAQFLPATTTSVAAWRPTDIPVLSFLDSANPEMFECWRALEEKLVVGYQVFSRPGASFTILEGDLPRSDVENCVGEALLYNQLSTGEVHRDGDLTVVETKLGTVYAAWRGRYVVVGSRNDVTTALAATALPVWTEASAELPGKDGFARTAGVAIGTDLMFAGLLGVATTRWKIVIELPSRGWPAKKMIKSGADALERFGEEQARIAERKKQGLPPEEPAAAPTPPPRDPVFGGSVEIRYATAADATRAGQALAQGKFAFELEQNLAAALSRLPQSITGSTLIIHFDQAKFAGVELEKLQAWMARMQAATAR